MNGLQKQYPEIYQNLLSCSHQADCRSPLAYGRDLVASWIFEDFLCQALQNNHQFTIQLDGADQNRMILATSDTSSGSDYLITSPTGRQLRVELVNDYTGFWHKHQKLHLRDQKYLRLQNSHSLLLAIAISEELCEFTVFDFRNTIPATYIPSHKPYGGKPAYELHISRSVMKSFTALDVTNSLQQCLQLPTSVSQSP